jgi:hypothetical protein
MMPKKRCNFCLTKIYETIIFVKHTSFWEINESKNHFFLKYSRRFIRDDNFSIDYEYSHVLAMNTLSLVTVDLSYEPTLFDDQVNELVFDLKKIINIYNQT